MKKYGLITLALLALISINASAESLNESQEPKLYDSIVGAQRNAGGLELFDSKFLIKANMACGFAPFPPLGCVVGACVCDQYGQNCQWTFICK
jgi:hypothetical protein